MTQSRYDPVTPDSVLTFSNDWTVWLPGGQAITSHLWSIAPDEGSMIAAATATVATVSGFVAGKVYRLKEVVVTDGGLTAARQIILRCEDR